jgi:hypothetical protein
MQRTNVYASAKEGILKRFSNVLEILQGCPRRTCNPPACPPTGDFGPGNEYALRQSMECRCKCKDFQEEGQMAEGVV